MSQLLGPDFITLLVSDLEVSRRFYADDLALPLSPERQPNAVAFATKPIPFAIRQAPGAVEPGPRPGQGIVLWLRADDATALQKVLKARGVPIVQDLAQGPFGKTFTLRDPDGYLLTVHDGG